MKTIFLSLFILIFLGMPALSFGAGTITATAFDYPKVNLRVIKFICTADAADGSYPAGQDTTTLNVPLAFVRGWYLYMVVTDPGATAPTDNYDLVINDAYGGDIMGGELANRDTATTEQAMPAVGSTYAPRAVETAITPVLTNNSVNSAIVDIYVYLRK